MLEIIKALAKDTNYTEKPNTNITQFEQANGQDLSSTVIQIINAVIGVLGLAAVVIVIIGGINYMMSSGEAAKVKKAKDTILYGVIGLVICVLAFAIVNFVIANILGQGK